MGKHSIDRLDGTRAVPVDRFVYALPDIAYAIPVTVRQPQYEGKVPLPERTMVLANGMFEDDAVWGHLGRWLIQAAWRRGELLSVVSYDDPFWGILAYEQADKTERLARVVRFSAQALDRPVHIEAHSRGWISAVEAARALWNEGVVSSIDGISPIGHTPHGNEVSQAVAVPRALGQILGQTISTRRLAEGLNGLYTSTYIASNLLRHISGMGAACVQEIGLLFGRNLTPDVVALQQDYPELGIGLQPTVYDTWAPAAEVEANLRAGGFTGPIWRLYTDHVGPLMEREWAPRIYDVATRLQQ